MSYLLSAADFQPYLMQLLIQTALAKLQSAETINLVSLHKQTQV